MERIEASDYFRMRNTTTHFELIFEEKTDTNKALEAIKEAIEAFDFSDPYLPPYAPLFLQDLGDSRTDKGFVTDSCLRTDEYDEYIPAMLKAVIKALPNAPFKGRSLYDDEGSYEIEFSYNGKQLHIKSTIIDDNVNGYFCPHCGSLVAYIHQELTSDEIECENCEKHIKLADCKYVPPTVEEKTIEF